MLNKTTTNFEIVSPQINPKKNERLKHYSDIEKSGTSCSKTKFCSTPISDS